MENCEENNNNNNYNTDNNKIVEEEETKSEHSDNSKQDEIEKIENATLQKKKRLMPKKGDFRMRAHINPLNDTPYPL